MPRPLPPPTCEPFFVAPARDEATVASALCMHGYTGASYEVLPQALALASAAGVACTGIVLPGHEGGPRANPAAMDHVTWRDWVRAAETAFDDLPRERPRFLVGSSMGALVALEIAARRPDQVAGLVLLATALQFFADGNLVAAAARRTQLWRAKPYLRKTKGSDIADDEARALHPCLPFLPIKGIAELRAMQRHVDALLPRVRSPLCLFHGAHDHTIPPAASQRVAQRASSLRVEHHVLRDSFHVIGLDVDRDQICDVAASFVREIVIDARASGAPQQAA